MMKKLLQFAQSLNSIRVVLIAGIGFILALTLLMGFTAYSSLQQVQSSVQTNINEANRMRNLSLEVENQFLTARQYEAEFLNQVDEIRVAAADAELIALNEEQIVSARTNIDEMNQIIASTSNAELASLTEELENLSHELEEYEEAFQKTTANLEQFSRADGLVADLDSGVSSLNDLAIANNEEEMHLTLDHLLDAQDEFLATGRIEYADAARFDMLDLAEIILQADFSSTERRQAATLLAEYETGFRQLILLEQDTAINRAIFQEETEVIAELIKDIEQQGEVSLTATRTELNNVTNRARTLLLATGGLATILATIISVLLLRRILTPLNRLTEAANAISQGDFSQTVKIDSQDEFAAVSYAFNDMTGRVSGLVNSLEARVEDRTRALSASSEVSRRISTILDRDQLIVEVVNLIQEAFGFYHVHIYLYDQTKQILRMVGGTGQAGQTMLVSNHSIPRGKGLVGSAAIVNQVINVPNVRQNEDWLANPLLPDTKSEIAVPIRVGTEALGVMDVQQDVEHGFSKEMETLLENLANQIGAALLNAESFANVKEQTDREALVNLISQKIQTAPTIDDVLQVAARELGLALGAEKTLVKVSAPSVLNRNGANS